MKERLAIIDGIRSPFAKVESALKNVSADDMAAPIVKEVVARTGIPANEIDELIFGNVAQPANAANIARVVALKAGLPQSLSAYTVHRNCASGMEAISTAYNKIMAGQTDIMVVGGTESMSKIPLLYNDEMKAFFGKLMRAKTPVQKLQTLLSFKMRYLKPVIGVMEGLTDPVCGLIMGLTAENLAKDFQIPREVQDQFALRSHQRAVKAQEAGLFDEEIHPIPLPPKMDKMQTTDVGPRKEQTIEALRKLKPYFDRKNGTVTVGNACPLTDGAAALVVMSESKAKAMKLKPLGYIREYAYAGLDPSRMGLGPVYATAKALDRAGMTLKDIQLAELNEAFAAQVIACQMAFDSDDYCKTYLGRDKKMGTLSDDILNVNGGAIAIGHPVGTTGARLVITLLREMRRRKLNTGLATLCIGGGQGGAMIVEAS